LVHRRYFLLVPYQFKAKENGMRHAVFMQPFDAKRFLSI